MVCVSVVIPIYSVEAYISEAIDSVLSQTFKDFELLLIDDGSPDGSVGICESFNDSRIRIIRQENKGLAGARNTGIRNTRGDFIAFLDGDDLWLPKKLEAHVNHFQANQEVGVSFTSSLIIDENSQSTNQSLNPKLKNISILDLLKSNPIGNGSAAVIRKTALEEIAYSVEDDNGSLVQHYFDETLRRAEDIELWLRLAIKTDWRFEGIEPPLTLYRVNSEGLSSNFEQQFESLQTVLDKTFSYAPEPISRWRRLATAYQYIYLARTAARLGDKSSSIKYLSSAISSYWKIVLEKPKTVAYCTLNYLNFLK